MSKMQAFGLACVFIARAPWRRMDWFQTWLLIWGSIAMIVGGK